MTAAVRVDAPPRRMGWKTLPLRCLRCRVRLRDHGMLTHGGGIRCDACGDVHYVLVCAPVQMAFVAEVTAAELIDLARRGYTVAQTLAYIGAQLPDAAPSPPAP